MRNKRAVYTVITNNRSELQEPLFIDKDVDYYCFTDDPLNIKSKTYKIIKIESSDILLMKKYKICPHLIPELKGYDETIYHDGNIQIQKTLNPYFDKIKRLPIAIFEHPLRDCIYDELEVLFELSKSGEKRCGSMDNIEKVFNILKLFSYPNNNGLYLLGILIRNIKSDPLNKLMDVWLLALKNIFIRRDQATFTIAIMNTKSEGLINKLGSFDETAMETFKQHSHSCDV